jgi:hypothetical protein
LREGDLELPVFLSSTQYVRLWSYPDAKAAVAEIIRSVDQRGRP